jgi:hypothetical protein
MQHHDLVPFKKVKDIIEFLWYLKKVLIRVYRGVQSVGPVRRAGRFCSGLRDAGGYTIPGLGRARQG